MLRTITDVPVAIEWLRSTYLHVRVLKNPKGYKMSPTLSREQIETKLQELCMRGLNALAKHRLIHLGEYDIRPEQGGQLMAR